MTNAALIQPSELHDLIAAGNCLVVDCRFDLQHADVGRNAWLAGHIPGAVYAHLDEDLASPATSATGRHPLPSPAAFADYLGRSGWQPGMQTVAYDGGGGFLAARFWWLMKYFGLHRTALLDGGMAAWTAQSLPIESGETKVNPRPAPTLVPNPDCVLSARQVAEQLQAGEICLLDARNGPRFRGEMEPIDSAAGHVPGARNHPCDKNLGSDRRLRSGEELREAYSEYAGKDGAQRVVHMCGSGVTACHNLFAMELAGFDNNQLYVGSWSEWISDPRRPIATGAD